MPAWSSSEKIFQLVAARCGAALDDVALAVGLLEGEVARQRRRSGVSGAERLPSCSPAAAQKAASCAGHVLKTHIVFFWRSPALASFSRRRSAVTVSCIAAV